MQGNIHAVLESAHMSCLSQVWRDTSAALSEHCWVGRDHIRMNLQACQKANIGVGTIVHHANHFQLTNTQQPKTSQCILVQV